MAYKVIILYQLYMPSYFLGTFTEYPDLYHVTMVIKTKRYLDESELFQFMQSLPDLTLERIA